MYKHIFIAGTFDGLHTGHEHVLLRAFAEGKRVTIGLTSDEFVKRYKVHRSSFIERKKELDGWLKQNKQKADIIEIHDPWEPAASLKNIDALIVTVDNKQRGEEINKRRGKRGLVSLYLLEVPLVPAQDLRPISSTRIRTGEIDHAGRLILPDNLRPELQVPLGRVLGGDKIAESLEKHKNKMMIAVGDVTTKTLLDAGVTPALMIIDNLVNRKPYKELKPILKTMKFHTIKVKSGPGFISKSSVGHLQGVALKMALGRPILIEVDGEEDLLALPAIAYAPTGSIVYYGQPKKGLVEVEVTAENKKAAIALLSRFTQ